jgi:hypothetical protein
MSMTSTVILNAALCAAAIAPIYGLIVWAIKTQERVGHATPARVAARVSAPADTTPVVQGALAAAHSGAGPRV